MTELAYPPTRTVDAVEVLHGETIADPYRWLEDGDDPDTRAWTDRQNALTESYLARVPGRDAIRRRLDELLAIGAISVPTPARGRYFYQRRDGRQNQPVLYVRDGVDGEDRAAVDPNALDPAGTTALDWYFPSDDGRLLAYGLSENGSEQSVLHVLDVDRGELLADRIPRTRAADLAWLPDHSGFYYTRYPAPGEVPEGEEHYHRAIYFHALGTDPAGDRLVHRPAQKEYWPGVSVSPGRALAARRRGPDVRPDRPLSGRPRRGRDGPRARAGRRRAGGLVRRRGGARPPLPSDQSRGADLPALRSRSRASGARPVARAGPAPPRCGARRGPGPPSPSRVELPRAGVVAAPAGGPGRRPPPGGPAADAGQPVRPGRRVGRRRAVLRILLVHRPAERLPDRPGDRRADAVAAGRGGCGPEPVRGPPGRRSSPATARR